MTDKSFPSIQPNFEGVRIYSLPYNWCEYGTPNDILCAMRAIASDRPADQTVDELIELLGYDTSNETTTTAFKAYLDESSHNSSVKDPGSFLRNILISIKPALALIEALDKDQPFTFYSECSHTLGILFADQEALDWIRNSDIGTDERRRRTQLVVLHSALSTLEQNPCAPHDKLVRDCIRNLYKLSKVMTTNEVIETFKHAEFLVQHFIGNTAHQTCHHSMMELWGSIKHAIMMAQDDRFDKS